MKKLTYTVREYFVQHELTREMKTTVVTFMLFAVTSVAASDNVRYYSNSDAVPEVETVVGGQSVTLNKVIAQNPQYRALLDSLMSHKGGEMPVEFFNSFKILAHSLSKLSFRESLARYSVANNFVNVNMAFDNGIELEVTQFPDITEVAFSVLHRGEAMLVATTTAEVLAERMQNVLNDSKFENAIS